MISPPFLLLLPLSARDHIAGRTPVAQTLITQSAYASYGRRSFSRIGIRGPNEGPSLRAGGSHRGRRSGRTHPGKETGSFPVRSPPWPQRRQGYINLIFLFVLLVFAFIALGAWEDRSESFFVLLLVIKREFGETSGPLGPAQKPTRAPS
jgi:hypothetical protein